jgi:cell division septal protein FtsQ
MKVDSISVTSNANVLRIEELKADISRELEGEYLWVLPQNNLLLVRSRQLKKMLREKYRLIRNISIRRKFPNELSVHIEERESHISWCFNDKCFLVDERGEAFLELENNENEAVKVVDSSGKEIGLGERVADPEFIFFVEKIPQVMTEELHLELEGVFVTPSSMSNEVHVKTKEGWKVYFSTSRKLETQVEILKKIIRETVGKEKIGELEYVDLRIKGKAIYKLRQEREESDKETKEDDN